MAYIELGLITDGANNIRPPSRRRCRVIDRFSYPAKITPGEPFSVSLTVRNTGSSPFYYNWPVSLRLLDWRTRKAVWQQSFQSIDIRTRLPPRLVEHGRPAPTKFCLAAYMASG